MRTRWQNGGYVERAPPLELLRHEAGDVVAGGVDDGACVRLERLHEHAAGRVAAAAAGELCQELERPLLGAEVRQPEPGVGVDHRSELDAGEVMALRDHLRPDEHGAVGPPEPLERVAQLLRLLDRVGVEADPLELRHVLLQLALELLRARADPRQLGRAAGRADLPHRLERAAVVAAQRPVLVQRERDVAALAPPRRPAGAAVHRGRHPPPVQQQDRLPAALRKARPAPRAAAPTADSPPRGAGRRRGRKAAAPRSVRRARAAPAAPTTPGAASPTRTRRPRLRATRASLRPCARRTADPTPACTTSPAPRRCRSRRAPEPARTPPSARRRRRARRRTRSARARRAAPPRSAPSGGRRRGRRTARGSGRASAASARSPGRGRSRRGRGRAPPRMRGCTPRSFRCRSRRRAGRFRRRRRGAR